MARLLKFGALTLDVANARASFGELHAALGQTETRLLAFFIGLPEKVFSRAQLLQRLWPSNVRVEERTVDVHIRRLRLALEMLGCSRYIQTVRGSGYRFSALSGEDNYVSPGVIKVKCASGKLPPASALRDIHGKR